MVNLVLFCLLQSLPGPPFIIFDTGTYQLYPKNKRLCSTFDPNRDVTFELYTKQNYEIPQILKIGNVSSVERSNINFTNPTVLFLHGYLESSKSDDAIKTKNNLERLKGEGFNVIIANMQSLLAGPFYVTSSLNVEPIGKYIALFVDFLLTLGLNRKNFHVIGMSLGAHIAGVVGKNVKGPKLDRITGLDPAGPLFNGKLLKTRLSKGDAEFVDVIHTNAGLFGIRSSIGDVDVWFNGGHFQPGCGPFSSLKRQPGSISELVFCNHYQAWRLYVKTIVNGKEYMATKCKNYRDFKRGKCNDNEKIYAGKDISRTARGDYFVNTGVTAVNV